MRLLVIEDDPDLNRQLATALTDAGYVVDRAFDGEEGHYLGETEPYDAVILDIGLPKMDGISVLESWRRAGRAMPVLMLTARDRWSDKVQGFDAGADDYVAKPFHLEEILARIRALLRRSTGHAQVELICGPVTLNTRTKRVSVNGNPIKLTSHEYNLLEYLMHHIGRVVSRTASSTARSCLATATWSSASSTRARNIHIPFFAARDRTHARPFNRRILGLITGPPEVTSATANLDSGNARSGPIGNFS